MTAKLYEVATYWVKGRDPPVKSHVNARLRTARMLILSTERPGYKLYRVTATSGRQAKKFAQAMRANDEGFGDRPPVNEGNRR